MLVATDTDFGMLKVAVDSSRCGDALRSAFARVALALDGPGFAFVTLSAPGSDTLEVVALPRNDSVLTIAKPGVIICDLWEHAWRGSHNDLSSWLDAFWTIVDWDVCSRRYDALRHGRQPQ